MQLQRSSPRSDLDQASSDIAHAVCATAPCMPNLCRMTFVQIVHTATSLASASGRDIFEKIIISTAEGANLPGEVEEDERSVLTTWHLTAPLPEENMSAPFLPPPKAGGGLPAFPGLAPGGGMPDFSKFAQPREKATVAMPAFANVVPKTKPPPPGSLGQSGPPSPKKKSSSGGHLALFTATHKQWAGQVELSANGKFTRVGKDGGLWSIDWDSQRENDDGDRSGALRLTWSKWGLESLRTTDGGRTFKCPEYQFELELMSTVVPGWIVTGPDDSAGDSAPAPPPPSSSSNDSSWRQTEPAPSSSDGTWLRGQTVPDKDGDGPGPAAGGRSEPEPAKQDQPTSRPVRPGRMGFKMPSRAERATGLTRKYKEIGSILMSEEAMKGVEPTAVCQRLFRAAASARANMPRLD